MDTLHHYHVSALSPPADWNQPGEYETKSLLLADQTEPTSWRAHRSTAALAEALCADKVATFQKHLAAITAARPQPNDQWSVFRIPLPPGLPDSRLVVHQSIADPIPTLYLVPIGDDQDPISIPGDLPPIHHRA